MQHGQLKSVKRRWRCAPDRRRDGDRDFAHHPTAIAKHCARCARLPPARLWAILEPRSNTLRRKVLESIWWRACAWPTASCWPAFISSNEFPKRSGCTRKKWCER